jgi:4a-hydroxytetrahydrobiopterin dehydratase
MTDTTPMTPSEFHASDGLADWRVLGDGAYAFFPTSSFAASVELVRAIGAIAGIGEHPPAVDVRHDGVTVRLVTVTDDSYGMSAADADVARAISAAARDRGLGSDPTALQNLLVIPGAPAGTDVMPFWRAILGYEPRPDSPDEDLVDPHDRAPAFWFEAMDEPRGNGGGAIHVAVWVPHDQAEQRLAAARAAGGRIVHDAAPRWWTLVDPAGNEADVATVTGRD